MSHTSKTFDVVLVVAALLLPLHSARLRRRHPPECAVRFKKWTATI